MDKGMMEFANLLMEPELRAHFEAKFRTHYSFESYKTKYENYLDGMSAEKFADFEDLAEISKKNFEADSKGDPQLWMQCVLDVTLEKYDSEHAIAAVSYMFYAHIYSGIDIEIAYDVMASNFHKIVSFEHDQVEGKS